MHNHNSAGDRSYTHRHPTKPREATEEQNDPSYSHSSIEFLCACIWEDRMSASTKPTTSTPPMFCRNQVRNVLGLPIDSASVKVCRVA
jgi:hypothetical protein